MNPNSNNNITNNNHSSNNNNDSNNNDSNNNDNNTNNNNYNNNNCSLKQKIIHHPSFNCTDWNILLRLLLPPSMKPFVIGLVCTLIWIFTILSITQCQFMIVHKTTNEMFGLYSRPYYSYFKDDSTTTTTTTTSFLGCIQYSKFDTLDSFFVIGRMFGTITTILVTIAFLCTLSVFFGCCYSMNYRIKTWTLSRYIWASATVTQMFTFLMLDSTICDGSGDGGMEKDDVGSRSCSLAKYGILAAWNTALLAILTILIIMEPTPEEPWLHWWINDNNNCNTFYHERDTTTITTTTTTTTINVTTTDTQHATQSLQQQQQQQQQQNPSSLLFHTDKKNSFSSVPVTSSSCQNDSFITSCGTIRNNCNNNNNIFRPMAPTTLYPTLEPIPEVESQSTEETIPSIIRKNVSRWDVFLVTLEQKSQRYGRLILFVLLFVSWIISIIAIQRCTLMIITMDGMNFNESIKSSSFVGFGLFTQLVSRNDEALGCIRYNNNAIHDFDASIRTGRAFGTISLFMMTFILLTNGINLFHTDENGTAWKLSQCLLPCSTISHLIIFASFGSDLCNNPSVTMCRMGGAGVLLVQNIILLLILSTLFWVLQPPENPLLVFSKTVTDLWTRSTLYILHWFHRFDRVNLDPSTVPENTSRCQMKETISSPSSSLSQSSPSSLSLSSSTNPTRMNHTAMMIQDKTFLETMTIDVTFTESNKKTIKTLYYRDGSKTIITTVEDLYHNDDENDDGFSS